MVTDLFGCRQSPTFPAISNISPQQIAGDSKPTTRSNNMETYRYNDDDLGPEEKALSEHLRKRAQAMGCECRPEVDHDPVSKVVVLSHNPLCPAWKHPGANPHLN